MTTTRLEAFSDGVLAIILTIMVLEMKAPRGAALADLAPVVPVFLSYVLSFVYVRIYWNNHHHLMQATHRVDGGTLWANLHLLFWLSLIPFVTGWMGQNHFATWPVALYGGVLFGCATAYTILQRRLMGLEGPASVLTQAFSRGAKQYASLALYALGIGLAFVRPWLGGACFVAVALLWLVPDRRVERALAGAPG